LKEKKIEIFSRFSAVDFIHSNFTEFLRSTSHLAMFESDSDSKEELTTLILELLRVNGTPLMDISLDLAPRNSSKYIGVIRCHDM
jgi:hypothetical protein